MADVAVFTTNSLNSPRSSDCLQPDLQPGLGTINVSAERRALLHSQRDIRRSPPEILSIFMRSTNEKRDQTSAEKNLARATSTYQGTTN
jgi:hypothetical protein